MATYSSKLNCLFDGWKQIATTGPLVALCIFWFCESSLAVPRTWIRSTGGAYFSALNWSPSGVPVAGDDVIFNLTSPTQEDITLIQNRTAADLVLNTGDMRFAGVGVDTFSLDNATVKQPAKLTIEGITSDYDFNIAGDLNVHGEFTLLNGSRLTSGITRVDSLNGSNAQLKLSRTTTTEEAPWWQAIDISIGLNNGGDVRVESSATVEANQLILGAGSLVVTGTDGSGNPSSFTSLGPAQLGLRPESLLRVIGGGQMSVLSMGVGVIDSATVEIGGRGSQGRSSRLDIENFLLVTDSTLTVSDGGQLSSGNSQVSLGSILVTDPGSSWVTSGVFLANGGTGLQIKNDARVASETVEIGEVNRGYVGVDGGIWTNSDDVFVGGSQGAGNSAGGTLEVNDGLALIGGKLTIWQNGVTDLMPSGRLVADRVEHTHGGQFQFSGYLQVNRFDGDLNNQSGELAPAGSAAGATNVFGNYSQDAAAKLTMQIGGITPQNQHDLVTVSGNTSLEGVLEVSLTNGFLPDADNTFTILSSNGIFGFFDNVATGQRLDTTDGGGSFVVNYGIGSAFDESQVVLSDFLPTVSLPGDYNNDGSVDLADYTMWRNNLGAPAGSLANDINGGVIGNNQYNTWRTHLGTIISASLVSSVPEPSTLLLFAGGVLLTLSRSKHLKHRLYTLLIATMATPLAAQQIVIDPNNTGANDVVELDNFSGIHFPLSNPLSSPLNLGAGDDLLIGISTARGELLLHSGGVLTAGEVRQGNGTTVVDGVGSRLIANSDLTFGLADHGEFDSVLTISHGGVAEAQEVFIGYDLQLSDGATIATIDGPGSQLTSNGRRLTVGFGNGSRSTLHVLRGGTVTADELIIGSTISDNSSSVAEVFVDGPDSLLAVNEIQAGGEGVRELYVSNGARVETQNLVLGSDIGANPRGGASVNSGGVLHIESGIKLDSPDLHFVGGTLSLGGDRFYSGHPGNSNLNAVLEPRGGSLSSGETLRIDGDLDAQATVTLAGGKLSVGTLTNASAIDLVRGTLELRNIDLDVTDGGQFGDRLSLGFDQRMNFLQTVRVASDGRVELEGGRLDAGSLVNQGLITGRGRIGGSLTNEQGGTIRVIGSNELRFDGPTVMNDGQVHLIGSASAIEFDEHFTNSEHGELNIGGTIVSERGLSNAGNILMFGGAPNLVGNMINRGSVEVTGSSVATFFGNFSNLSDLEIRQGSDAVIFNDLTLHSSSNVIFELGQATEHNGLLNVIGDVSLAGELQIELSGGFSPQVGDVFALATVGGSLTGDFADILSPAGYVFGVNVHPSSVTLEVLSQSAVLAGDFNDDGIVDLADYTVWRNSLGDPVGALANDTVGGAIGLEQYALWKSNVGGSLIAASASIGSNVPEPSCWSILGLGAIACLLGKQIGKKE